MRRVYLDYNSSSPIDKEVKEAIMPFLEDKFGNPSNLHSFGRETREAIESARKKIAEFLNTKPERIFFTSGGTESCNWAIKGIAFANRNKGNHIITSSIEHSSVLNSCLALKDFGFEITFLPVDEYGMVDIDYLKKSIKKNTILVSIMHSNNEVGTIQPIEEISQILKNYDILFHTDAVASAGKIKLDVRKLGVDLLTISGHKIHAPKGIGILYIREGVKIENLIHGGHHEQSKRAGTENLIGIVGMGKACEILMRDMEKDVKRIRELRDYLEKKILENIEDIKINGHLEKRLCNTTNISFGYVEGEALLVNLDLEGIAVASGSACASGEPEPSHVLKAMNVPIEYINSPVRFSLGRENTKEEIDYTIEVVIKVVKRLREITAFKKRV
ncbi:MAG: cysteine desulfurase NifS [candidate division WOR-3 bacterium]